MKELLKYVVSAAITLGLASLTLGVNWFLAMFGVVVLSLFLSGLLASLFVISRYDIRKAKLCTLRCMYGIVIPIGTAPVFLTIRDVFRLDNRVAIIIHALVLIAVLSINYRNIVRLTKTLDNTECNALIDKLKNATSETMWVSAVTILVFCLNLKEVQL